MQSPTPPKEQFQPQQDPISSTQGALLPSAATTTTDSPSSHPLIEPAAVPNTRSRTPSAEGQSRSTRVSEGTVEDIKSADRSRPQSPVRLKLFPKRPPVRTIVKSMETAPASEAPPPTSGLTRRGSTHTSSSRPTTPAADQIREKEAVVDSAKASPPASTLAEMSQLPTDKEKQSLPPPTQGSSLSKEGAPTDSSKAPKSTAQPLVKAVTPMQESPVVVAPVDATTSTRNPSNIADANSQPGVQPSARDLDDPLTKVDSVKRESQPGKEGTEQKPLNSTVQTSEPPASAKVAVKSVRSPSEADHLSSLQSPPESKSLPSPNIIAQEIPHPYLSQSSSPPKSPLPPIPSLKSPEVPEPEPQQEPNIRISRRPSGELSSVRNRQSRTGRSSLERSTTPDILTRRTSQDRLSRNPTFVSGASSNYPSTRISLKLPVNPSNGFSPSGRISPLGRSPTPDTHDRKLPQQDSVPTVSRSPSAGVTRRESVSSQRASLDVPHHSTSINLGQSGRASPYMRSPTPDTLVRRTSRDRISASPVPSTALDFLVALAAQERLVLELKEEQQQAEVELEILKQEWAAQGYKKQDALTQVEELFGHVEATHVTQKANVKETGKKVEEAESSPQVRRDRSPEPSATGEVRVRERKVFQGSREMRPLSLLSPIESNSRAPSPSPRSIGRSKDTAAEAESRNMGPPLHMLEPESEPESDLDMEAEMDRDAKERFDALSIIQEEASTKSIKHDSMPPLPDDAYMRRSLQLATEFREGIETFLENLKQANSSKAPTPEPDVNDVNDAAAPPRKKSRKEAPKEEQQSDHAPLELKHSNSLIKTTVVAGAGEKHHSTFIDLDSDFFDSDLWREPLFKTPVVFSPKREETQQPSRTPRRYLNLESEEDLTLSNSAGQLKPSNPQRKSPTSTGDTASTRRGSTSTDRSNPRSSTTSTHEDAIPKRASSPLLAEALPALATHTAGVPSPKTSDSKSSTTIKAIAAQIDIPPSPSTITRKTLVNPTSPKSPKSPKSPGQRGGINEQSEQEEVIVPRLLPPRGGRQEPTPVSRFSVDVGGPAKFKETALNWKIKLEKSMSSPISTSSSGKKKKEREEKIENGQENDVIPRQIFAAATSIKPPPQSPRKPVARQTGSSSPNPTKPNTTIQDADPSAIRAATMSSPTPPFSPRFVHHVGRASNATATTSGRTDKELPPLPPTFETSVGRKTTSTSVTKTGAEAGNTMTGRSRSVMRSLKQYLTKSRSRLSRRPSVKPKQRATNSPIDAR